MTEDLQIQGIQSTRVPFWTWNLPFLCFISNIQQFPASRMFNFLLPPVKSRAARDVP